MGKIKKKSRNHTISELFFKLGFPRFGGDKRDRTADLLNAIQALSQLSYTPGWPFQRLSGHFVTCKY